MRFSALLILLFALPLGRAESDQHGGGEEPVLDPINSRSGSEMPVYKGLRAPVGRVWRSTAFLTPATFLAMAIAMAYLIVHCFIALKAHKSRSYQQISARRLASAPEEFCSVSSDEKRCVTTRQAFSGRGGSDCYLCVLADKAYSTVLAVLKLCVYDYNDNLPCFIPVMLAFLEGLQGPPAPMQLEVSRTR